MFDFLDSVGGSIVHTLTLISHRMVTERMNGVSCKLYSAQSLYAQNNTLQPYTVVLQTTGSLGVSLRSRVQLATSLDLEATHRGNDLTIAIIEPRQTP